MNASCQRCGLPGSDPGVELDADGLCRLCREAASPRLQFGEAALRALIEQRAGDAPFACLVSYSGGKDSTFMLRRLAEWFPGRVLAFTFDTGTMSESVFANIDRVTTKLGVDLVRFSPAAGFMRAMFQTALRRLVALRKGTIYARGVLEFGPLCYACGTLYHLMALRTAVDHGIGVVTLGFTPAQDSTHYPHAHALLSQPSQLHRAPPSARQEGMRATEYLTMAQPMLRLLETELGERTLEIYRVPAARLEDLRLVRFYDFVDYDESRVRAQAAEVGFIPPQDASYGSTNCALNPLIRHIYAALYGCDKYRAQDAALVRWGLGKREDVLARATPLPALEDILPLLERVGMTRHELEEILDGG
jgi:hypothetical protein